jgi:uracil-DNA glycosylase
MTPDTAPESADRDLAVPLSGDALTGLVALLEWYRDMGVDAALSDTATDWLQPGRAPPGAKFAMPSRPQPGTHLGGATFATTATPGGGASASAAPTRSAEPRAPLIQRGPTPPPARQFPTAAPDTATEAARAAAAKSTTLAALQAQLQAFDDCALKATAKNLCFYRGAAQAQLLIIGEAPGRDEDQEGRPITAADGQLLDRMLAAIGLIDTKTGDAKAHITNIVYWRPPGNRTPSPQEARVCRPFLDRQIQLVAPKVILLLGGMAAKFMLDVPDGILKLRGRWRELEVGGSKIKTMATLPPSYLLKTPAAKRQAWADLLQVKAALDG